MPDSSTLFDTRLLQLRRDRAAARFDVHDFLVRAAAERLAGRLDDVQRNFAIGLDIGCHTGQLRDALAGRIAYLIEGDISSRMLARCTGPAVQYHPEWLPFAHGRLDVVLSALSLHWVNDLPGALAQIRRALQDEGLFMAVLPGANTLIELRHSLAHAQSTLMAGASPQIAPAIDIRDGGNLLQRAGFVLPTADSETLTVTYDNALALMQDLRGMAETNMLLAQHRGGFPRGLFPLAAQYYAEHYPAPDAPGRIRATFELVTLTGWSS